MSHAALLCYDQVVYYGETAYWVSVDIDVPLFLPLYGERRLHDLRLIARQEVSGSQSFWTTCGDVFVCNEVESALSC
jgi:hypothetical protein